MKSLRLSEILIACFITATAMFGFTFCENSRAYFTITGSEDLGLLLGVATPVMTPVAGALIFTGIDSANPAADFTIDPCEAMPSDGGFKGLDTFLITDADCTNEMGEGNFLAPCTNLSSSGGNEETYPLFGVDGSMKPFQSGEMDMDCRDVSDSAADNRIEVNLFPAP